MFFVKFAIQTRETSPQSIGLCLYLRKANIVRSFILYIIVRYYITVYMHFMYTQSRNKTASTLKNIYGYNED